MVKTVYIKLTKTSPTSGPFNIYDQWGNLIDSNVSRKDLIDGKGYILNGDVTMIKLVDVGDCPYEKIMPIVSMTEYELFTTDIEILRTGCIWRHLTNPVIYNYFYGVTEPYIIEYPFAYEYYDQIVQNVKDYTKAYRYSAPIYTKETPLASSYVELDDEWFNKAIVYNGQECSGILGLAPKPKGNLKEYMSYPKYNSDSKTIIYTKSDNYYQYNTFWDIVVNKSEKIFTQSCESLSIDKVVNQTNMDYTIKSFSKSPIRAKELKVRHILDDKNDLHLVSRVIFAPSQISYK